MLNILWKKESLVSNIEIYIETKKKKEKIDQSVKYPMKGLLAVGITETERTYEKHKKNISSLMKFLYILDDDDE